MTDSVSSAPPRSCMECPSFLDRHKANETFKNDAGPMCERYGHVFGKPDSAAGEVRKIAQEFAGNCADLGKPRPIRPLDGREFPAAQVAEMNVSVVASPRDPNAERPSTCVECKFFISQQVVAEQCGWHLPMCAATGQLLFTRNHVKQATKCEYGVSIMHGALQPGDQPKTTNKLLPFYEKAFDGDYDGEAPFFVEPATFTSSEPVAPSDVELGVRAWRPIDDPAGYGKSVKLPVFALASFPDDWQALVPKTGDDGHPEFFVDHMGLEYKIAAEWMGIDSNPVLHGHAGVGKTEFARHMAWKMQLPFVAINFDATTMPDDIVGSWVFMDGETTFAPGRLTSWWSRPCVLLLDEYKLAPDEIQGMLRPVFDGRRVLPLEKCKTKVKRPDGSVEYVTPAPLERHPYCFPILAANPEWSPLYVGVNPDDPAGISRKSHIWVDLPPVEVERDIIVAACRRDGYKPPKDKIKIVQNIAAEIRQQIDAGTLAVAWGMREQIGVLRRTAYYKMFEAYRRTALDAYDPRTAQAVLDIVQRHATEKD